MDQRGNAKLISDTVSAVASVRHAASDQTIITDRVLTGGHRRAPQAAAQRARRGAHARTRSCRATTPAARTRSTSSDYPMIRDGARHRPAWYRASSPRRRAATRPPPCPLLRRHRERHRGRRRARRRLAQGRRQGRRRGPAPAALRHGPRDGDQPAARLPRLVLHRPSPEAHRAQRRGHRRRRPLGQGAGDGRGRDRPAGGHIQHHGRAAAGRLRSGRVRARPRRGPAQRPERRRDRPLRRRHRDHRQPGVGRAAGRDRPRGRRSRRESSRPTSPTRGASHARTATSRSWCSCTATARWRPPRTRSAGAADFTSIVVLRDVTAQARLERARRDLIANASHEFKTPLFSLAGFLELIDEGNVSPEEHGEFLQLMRQQVDRLRNLAVSMLDLSRVEAGLHRDASRRTSTLEAVARSVLDEFQVQAQTKEPAPRGRRRRGRHRVVRRAAPGAGAARARRQRRQVLAVGQHRARLGARATTTRATVVVSDDGPGIPQAELPHVFERFHRGSEERATHLRRRARSLHRPRAHRDDGREHPRRVPGRAGASFSVSLPRAPRPRRGDS